MTERRADRPTADDLAFVPKIGFRSVHALGARANVVVRNDGGTLEIEPSVF